MRKWVANTMTNGLLGMCLFSVASIVLAGEKPAKPTNKDPEEVAEALLNEIAPMVKKFLGGVEDWKDYNESDVAKRLEEYSKLIARRNLPRLLQSVDSKYRYTPPKTTAKTRFKALTRFILDRKAKLPSHDDYFKLDDLIVAAKKNGFTSETLSQAEAMLAPYEPFIAEVAKKIHGTQYLFSGNFSADRNFSSVRYVARLFNYAVHVNIAKKRPDAAYRNALLGLEYASMLEKDQGPLIDHLVAIACKAIALDSVNHLLKSRQLSEKQLAGLIEALSTYKARGENFKKSIITEYRFILQQIAGFDFNNVTMVKAQLVPLTFFMDESFTEYVKGIKQNTVSHEKVMEHIEAWLKVVLKDVKRQTPWKKQARSAHFQQVKAMLRDDKKNNLFSLRFVDAIYSSLFVRTTDKFFTGMNHENATRVAAAIQLYERKHSKLPKDMEALVGPEMLKERPIDFWTGKAYSINWKKRIIQILKCTQQRYDVTVNF